MKNGDFQSIVNALSRHPNLARIDEPLIYGQTLVFKNLHNPDAQLHIYVERVCHKKLLFCVKINF
jgi:hypothetical protein